MTESSTTAGIGWHFDNSYARLPNILYTKLNPTPVQSPSLVIVNDSLATALGLHADALRSKEGIAVFAGNQIPTGAEPLAQAYAGHQFGHFTMLGDGRALLLGEQVTPHGARFDIQLKGSGRTPYSRGGDGRAALGPMLREYIISEAMHGLRIPTTRSLAVVETGEPVYRETELPGAVLTRVAASHLRVGTFQYAARWGTVEDLRSLADYALRRHYVEPNPEDNRYLFLLKAVIKRQAELIARWQLAGFIHGVMNTDNMTISGETIDYGPCPFMDTYSPETVFSSIDIQGRYAYGNQPYIGSWNLARLAEALLPLLHEKEEQAVERAEAALAQYGDLFEHSWLQGMRSKLGLFHEEEGDKELIRDLLQLMQRYRADYTNTFRELTLDSCGEPSLQGKADYAQWVERWQARRSRQEQSVECSYQLMRDHNPAVIARNHRVEEALEAAVERKDYSVMERLLQVLQNPYAYSPAQVEYAVPSEPSEQPYRTYCGT